MVYFLRVVLCGLLLLTGVHSSYASFPATTSGLWNGWTGKFSTPLQACQNIAQSFGYSDPYIEYDLTQNTDPFCVATKSDGSSYRGTIRKDLNYSCPSGATAYYSTCHCNSGFTQSGSSCVPVKPVDDPVCTESKGAEAWVPSGTSVIAPGKSICNSPAAGSYCSAVAQGGYCGIKGGVKKCFTEIVWSGGAACSPTPVNTEGTEAPVPCKGSFGTVNGVEVCIPIGSDPSTSVETTTTTSDTTNVSGGPSTSTSSTATTTCTGSSCSTETKRTDITTRTDGSTSTVITIIIKEEPKADFCTKNPRASQCLTGSFGGSCSGGFVCDGDAVMCAIAADQHRRHCQLFDTSNPESALYESEKLKASFQLPNEDVAIGPGSFDTSDSLGGRSCIGDRTISVMGWTGTVPLSSVCPHLAVLGNVLMLVSFVLSARIVARG